MAQCKYHKLEELVSYDGIVWESQDPPVYIKGGFIDYGCDSPVIPLENWVVVAGDYICDNNNKYVKELLKYSYDGGLTWYPSTPAVFRAGSFVGVDVEFCSYSSENHYVIVEDVCKDVVCSGDYAPRIINGKCVCVYVDPVRTNRCSESGKILTKNSLNGGKNYALVVLKLGECVEKIANSACTGDLNGAFLQEVDTSKAVNLEEIGNYAFNGCHLLTSIAIPPAVSAIGEGAFSGCPLTSVTFSTNATASALTIGSQSFNGVVAPDLNLPSIPVTISSYAFENATLGNLTINKDSIISDSAFTQSTVGNLTINSGVSIGDYAFYGTSGLNTVVISSGCTLGVYTFSGSGVVNLTIDATNIPNATFAQCSSLSNVTIGSNTTTIGASSFFYCISLSSTTIGSGVTSIGNEAFYGCYMTVSNFVNNSSLDEVANNYWGCTIVDYEIDGLLIKNNSVIKCRSNVTNVTIPEGVTSIGNTAFYNCRSLTSVTMPYSLTNIGFAAFDGCSGLTSITCLATTPPYVDNSTLSRTSLSAIYVSSGSVSTYKAASGWSTFASIIQPIQETITYRWVDDGFTCKYHDKWKQMKQQQSLDDGATWHDTGVVSATSLIEKDSEDCGYIPPKWLATYADSHTASAECDSTSAITQYEVTKENLVQIEIGSSCVITIGDSAFGYCSSLTSVTIPDSVTSIGSSAFGYCSSLTSVTIPNSVTTIGDDAFYGCTSLTSVTIGSGVTSIGEYAFAGCSSLTSIDIPSGVTKIENGTFFVCSGLTSVTIPNSVTSIGGNAFERCSSLTSVTIGNSVTSIGMAAFADCTGITSVTIPSGVTSIGEYAFAGCSSLTSVTVEATTPPALESFAFTDTNDCPLLVPAQSVDVYKSTSGWSTYADRIQPLP